MRRYNHGRRRLGLGCRIRQASGEVQHLRRQRKAVESLLRWRPKLPPIKLSVLNHPYYTQRFRASCPYPTMSSQCCFSKDFPERTLENFNAIISIASRSTSVSLAQPGLPRIHSFRPWEILALSSNEPWVVPRSVRRSFTSFGKLRFLTTSLIFSSRPSAILVTSKGFLNVVASISSSIKKGEAFAPLPELKPIPLVQSWRVRRRRSAHLRLLDA